MCLICLCAAAAGDTFEETKVLIAEAVELHLELMEEEGLPIPDPTPLRIQRGSSILRGSWCQ